MCVRTILVLKFRLEAGATHRLEGGATAAIQRGRRPWRPNLWVESPNDRIVVRGLGIEYPHLRVGVLLERVVAVEVVRHDIRDSGDSRTKVRYPFELKGADLRD